MANATERSDLIEGGVGPFYVALNRAAFFLVAGVFVAIIPVALYLVRDAALPIMITVAGGIALEAGAVAHILLERVMRRPAREAWVAHAIVSAGLAAALVTILL